MLFKINEIDYAIIFKTMRSTKFQKMKTLVRNDRIIEQNMCACVYLCPIDTQHSS